MMKSSFEIAGPHDDHDEYWDDEEDESDDGDDDEESDNDEEEAHVNDGSSRNGRMKNGGSSNRQNKQKKKAKMKRMKVATQRDYHYSLADVRLDMLYLSPRARGICCISTIVCFLVLGAVYLVVPHTTGSSSSHSAEYEAGYEAGGSGGRGDSLEPTCTVHTTKEPFSEWMHHIRKANATDLCREEISSTKCKCHNPFQVEVDDEHAGWHDVFDTHLQNLNKTLLEGYEYDLILYGDSIIEHMNGMVFGKHKNDLKDQLDVTTELLTKERGGKINAFPLGIAGDEVHSLLYRLYNGEMPVTLQPSAAWWLMIGTNDVVKGDCGVDAVVAGISAAAQEIWRRDEINRHDDAAPVVINSLFPRLKLDADPLWSTIQTINSRLECYAESSVGVEFFNATDLFVSQQSDGSFSVNPNLFLEDGIHLSVEGTRVWEEAIVQKTLDLKSRKR